MSGEQESAGSKQVVRLSNSSLTLAYESFSTLRSVNDTAPGWAFVRPGRMQISRTSRASWWRQIFAVSEEHQIATLPPCDIDRYGQEPSNL